ncbi:MAG TPA: tRNA pseudouridine(55) synthase TruB [Rudaea sp.]|nr:tRNA pseudouridine(55) synthase TruB [Rudaea sp.]
MSSRFRDVDGILLFDKPKGLSSNQALQRVRHLFGARKAGHTGSLDPPATGLLPICFGEATKIAGYLLGSRKAYVAECVLGSTTNTDDADGEVITTRPVPENLDIESALRPLRGRIVQTPPKYAAIKMDGVALYKRARRGEDVEPPPRDVDVHRLDLIGRDGNHLRLHVECGSGTYVRSLARDIGETLGCGAHLTALRRIWVDPFREPSMVTLDELSAMTAEEMQTRLLPLEQGLAALPGLTVDDGEELRLRQGKTLEQTILKDVPLARAMDSAGRLVALVEIDDRGEVRVRRGFGQRAPAGV